MYIYIYIYMYIYKHVSVNIYELFLDHVPFGPLGVQHRQRPRPDWVWMLRVEDIRLWVGVPPIYDSG